jgi:hypothetical protein
MIPSALRQFRDYGDRVDWSAWKDGLTFAGISQILQKKSPRYDTYLGLPLFLEDNRLGISGFNALGTRKIYDGWELTDGEGGLLDLDEIARRR